MENGINVTKLIQVFSKQASMMDALISHYTEQLRRRKESTGGDNTPPSNNQVDLDTDGN